MLLTRMFTNTQTYIIVFLKFYSHSNNLLFCYYIVVVVVIVVVAAVIVIISIKCSNMCQAKYDMYYITNSGLLSNYFFNLFITTKF